MLSRIITGLLVLTISTIATEPVEVKVESPQVSAKNNFYYHPWGTYDFV